MAKLVKLSIQAYLDGSFKRKTGKKIKVQFNPAEISINWGSGGAGSIGKGTAKKALKLTNGKFKVFKIADFAPASASFNLILDNSISNIGKPITEQIKAFKKTCLNVDADVHAPNYIQLIWGEFIFKCQLTSLNIKYTLFTPDGIPIRAELGCNFKGFEDSFSKARREGERSPDMTKIVTIRAGDSLPILCNEHYGSPKYYLQVARQNGLASPLYVYPGQRIVLPPLVDDISVYYKDNE